jgi:hypothetical protein
LELLALRSPLPPLALVLLLLALGALEQLALDSRPQDLVNQPQVLRQVGLEI